MQAACDRKLSCGRRVTGHSREQGLEIRLRHQFACVWQIRARRGVGILSATVDGAEKDRHGCQVDKESQIHLAPLEGDAGPHFHTASKRCVVALNCNSIILVGTKRR